MEISPSRLRENKEKDRNDEDVRTEAEDVAGDERRDEVVDLDFQTLSVSSSTASSSSSSSSSSSYGTEEHVYKRTIEGSPMVSAIKKRVDRKTTPNHNSSAALFSSPMSSSSSSSTQSSSSQTSSSSHFQSDYSISPSRAVWESDPSALHYNQSASPARQTGYQAEKVLIVSSELSGGKTHQTTPGHQENAKRTALLTGSTDEEGVQTSGCLRRDSLQHALIWADKELFAPSQASLADILRVHEYSYVQHLLNKIEQIKDPHKPSDPYFYAPPGGLDSDTPLSQDSLNAAKNFCGAAIAAVERVLQNDVGNSANYSNTACGLENIKRAFVIGRPPGHHAGPNGCVPSQYFWLRPEMTSSGFCLLNTVAVAASYARYNYSVLSEGKYVRGHPSGSRPLRIAIVDIDVHHGNGTEEIVKNLRPHTTFLPLPSSWAPVGSMSYKPWLNEQDADEIFFSSINLYANDRFYPGSGEDTDCSRKDSSNILNIAMTPIGPGPWDPQGRAKMTSKQRNVLCKSASEEMRKKVEQSLLPKLRDFSPDLLFFSSGFDAHYDDMYHFLTEDDYHWLTKNIMDACSKDNDCKVPCRTVSVLEGGYSLSSSSAKKTNTRKGGKSASNRVEESTGSSFDIRGGDGGLVKGVLAHVAALANLDSWHPHSQGSE